MTLNESIFAAVLKWFGELLPQSHEFGYGRRLEFGRLGSLNKGSYLLHEAVRAMRLREVIRRLNLAIPDGMSGCAAHLSAWTSQVAAGRRATIRSYRIVRLERRLNP